MHFPVEHGDIPAIAMFVYQRVANEGLACEPTEKCSVMLVVTGMGGDFLGSWLMAYMGSILYGSNYNLVWSQTNLDHVGSPYAKLLLLLKWKFWYNFCL